MENPIRKKEINGQTAYCYLIDERNQLWGELRLMPLCGVMYHKTRKGRDQGTPKFYLTLEEAAKNARAKNVPVFLPLLALMRMGATLNAAGSHAD